MKALLGTAFCALLVVYVSAKSVNTSNEIYKITINDKMNCSARLVTCHPGESVGVVDQCQYFCYCLDGDFLYSDPTKCYLGKYYDSVTRKCVDNPDVCQNTPTNPVVGSKCSGSEIKPLLGDCYFYLQCIDSKWKVIGCGRLEYFDQSTKSCKFNYSFPFHRPCDV